MNRQSRLRRLAGVVALALLAPASAPAQATTEKKVDPRETEARRLMRLASNELPKIENPFEQGLLAANLAGRQAQAGDLEGAFVNAERVSTEHDKWRVFQMIATHQVGSGNLEAGLATLERIPAGEDRDTGLMILAKSQAARKSLGTAMKVGEMISETSPHRMDAMIFIAGEHLQQGNRAEGEQMLLGLRAQVLRDVEADPSRAPSAAFSLRDIAQLQFRASDSRTAWETLSHIDRLAEKAGNPRDKDRILMLLASEQARLGGQPAIAMDTLRKIASSSERESALSMIAPELAQNGDFVGALTLAREIQEPSSRDRALAFIAAAQAYAGNQAGARETVKEITNEVERARALEMIGRAQARRKPAEAAKAYDEAEQSAGRIESDLRQAEALERLAGARVDMADLDRALELAQRNPSPAFRGRALERVLMAIVARGDSARAYKVAEEQTEPIARAYAWFGIAQGLRMQVQRERYEAEKARRAAKP